MEFPMYEGEEGVRRIHIGYNELVIKVPGAHTLRSARCVDNAAFPTPVFDEERPPKQ